MRRLSDFESQRDHSHFIEQEKTKQKTMGLVITDQEILIQKPILRSKIPDKNYIKKLYQEIPRNEPETQCLYPERHYIDPGKIFIFRMTEVGRLTRGSLRTKNEDRFTKRSLNV